MDMTALLTTAAIALLIPITYSLRGHTPGHEKWMKTKAKEVQKDAKEVKRGAKKVKDDVKSVAGSGRRRERRRDGNGSGSGIRHGPCRCRRCMARMGGSQGYGNEYGVYGNGVGAPVSVSERGGSLDGGGMHGRNNWDAQRRRASDAGWGPGESMRDARVRDWSRSSSVAQPQPQAQLPPPREVDWSRRQGDWRRSQDSASSWNAGPRSAVGEGHW